jgi:hypothetical protein
MCGSTYLCCLEQLDSEKVCMSGVERNESCLMAIEFQFCKMKKFWRCLVVMMAQQEEYI